VCQCFPGFEGEDCTEASETCGDRCSGHGLCCGGSCFCDGGFRGDTCGLPPFTKKSNSSSPLSSEARFMAKSAAVPPAASSSSSPKVQSYATTKQAPKQCPKGCSGHGECFTDSGKCFCDPGWESDACDVELPCPAECSDSTGAGFHAITCKYGKCFPVTPKEPADKLKHGSSSSIRELKSAKSIKTSEGVKTQETISPGANKSESPRNSHGLPR